MADNEYYIRAFIDGDQKVIKEAYTIMKKPFVSFVAFKFPELGSYYEDVYHESFILLQENILKGVISTNLLTTTLLAYTEGIGFRVASRLMRRNKVEYQDNEKWNEFLRQHAGNYAIPGDPFCDEERDRIIRQQVEGMQNPCGKLLTGVFWDDWDIADIKSKMSYKSVDVAKTAKYKCMQKIKCLIKKALKENGY